MWCDSTFDLHFIDAYIKIKWKDRYWINISREVAQLEERLPCKRKVLASRPRLSRKEKKHCPDQDSNPQHSVFTARPSRQPYEQDVKERVCLLFFRTRPNDLPTVPLRLNALVKLIVIVIERESLLLRGLGKEKHDCKRRSDKWTNDLRTFLIWGL